VSQSDLMLARREIMKSRTNETPIDISGNTGYDGGIVGAEAEIARFGFSASPTVGIGNRWGFVLCLTWAFEVRGTGSRKWRNEKEVKPLKTLDAK
jgi:hypothetical protein